MKPTQARTALTILTVLPMGACTVGGTLGFAPGDAYTLECTIEDGRPARILALTSDNPTPCDTTPEMDAYAAALDCDVLRAIYADPERCNEVLGPFMGGESTVFVGYGVPESALARFTQCSAGERTFGAVLFGEAAFADGTFSFDLAEDTLDQPATLIGQVRPTDCGFAEGT